MKPEERKHNQQLWQERMTDWQRSGLPASGRCKKHDIKQHLFFYWKRKLITQPDNKLIPLAIVQPEPSMSSQVTFSIGSIHIEAAPEQAAALVEQQTGQSPFNQTVFVFCNRKRDKIKLLCWERNGFVLWYKRLEKFLFKWPGHEAPEAIDGDLLNQLLDGYDIRPKKPHPTLEYTTLL